MKTLSRVLAAVCLTLGAAAASAAPITDLYNTGVDGAGAPLASGAVDAHYLVGGSSPSYVVGTRPLLWLANDSTSQWIGLDGTTSIGPGGVTTVYRTTFTLPTDFTSAAVSGRWSADNGREAIYLNGTLNPANAFPGFGTVTGQFTGWYDFSFSSGFVAGTNTLDFHVYNFIAPATNPVPNPTGLRVEMAGTYAVPAPGTLALLALGLAGAGLLLPRRRAA